MAVQMHLDDNGRIVREDDEAPETPASRKAALAAGQARKSVGRSLEARRKESNTVGKLMSMFNPTTAAAALAEQITGGLGLTQDTPMQDMNRRALGGFTFGLDKRLRAGTGAVVDALSGENIGDAYNQNMTAEAMNDADLRSRTGLVGDIGELAGGALTPLKGAGAFVKGAELLRGGKALGKVGTHIIGGLGAGTTGGAALGAAQSEDFTNLGDVAQNTFNGALLGGAGGAALGGAAIPLGHLGRRVINSARGARGKAASAIEAGRAADEALLRAIDRSGGMDRIEGHVGEMVDQGADPRVVDVSKNTQSQLRALSDKGEQIFKEGGEQTEVGDVLRQRADLRAGRLRDKIAEHSGVDDSVTSAARQREMAEQRKAQAKIDYAPGGVLDTQIPQDIPRSLKRVVSPGGQPEDQTFERFLEQGKLDYHASGGPRISTGRFGQARTMPLRVMDNVLKNYRGKISSLFRDPATAGRAAGLRNQFEALRKHLYDKYPAYRDILERHATEMAKDRAAQMGDKLGPDVFKNPRKVMDVLRNPQAHGLEDVDLVHTRDALADRAFTLSEHNENSTLDAIRKATADPVRRPEANDLWEFILNGPDNVADMNKWIAAESRVRDTERRLGGTQTSTNLQGLATQEGDAQSLGVHTARLAGGTISGNQGIAMNSGALAIKYGLRLLKGEDAKAVDKLLLQRLMRRVDRGQLSRVQQRAANKAVARNKRTVRSMNKLGRVAKRAVDPFIGRTLPDDQEDQ